MPFSFKLPDNLPGTFHAGTTSIKYTVEVFVTNHRETLYKETEFEVREFLFTENEIEVDVQR